jgi:hypothetical protein
MLFGRSLVRDHGGPERREDGEKENRGNFRNEGKKGGQKRTVEEGGERRRRITRRARENGVKNRVIHYLFDFSERDKSSAGGVI